MKSTDDRKLFGAPIAAAAVAGNIATIPQTQATAGDGTASVALGFPPETFIARAAGGEPPRGQDMNGLLNLLSGAIQVLQAGYLGPFDAAFAQSIGGYPVGAVVAGAVPGAFWVSTADANVSTPGVDGATWQSLFNGYATQAWANGQFLQLADAATQTVSTPVAFSGANTHSGAETFTGPTSVPSVSAFAGMDALNAVTAEGRYVKSVPTTGQTRITDLVENTDGRTVSGTAAASAVLANLADLSSSVTQHGDLATDGSYTIQRLVDPSTPSGFRIRMSGVISIGAGGGPGGGTYDPWTPLIFPMSFNGVFPGAYGVSLYFPGRTGSVNADQGAQITSTPTTTGMHITVGYFTSTYIFPACVAWFVEGY